MDIFPQNNVKDAAIAYILDRPKAEVKVTAIAKELKLSKGHVSEAIKYLKAVGIIKGNKANLENPYVRSLKIAINMNKIIKFGIINKIKRLGVESAGVYGSWTKGTNNEDSDLDLWINTAKDIRAIDVARISGEISTSLSIETHILMLNKDKIDRIKRDNTVFYFSLVFGSMILIGDDIGKT